MTAPRQQLATILILSAIDVLLCGFTAALTLFFIGAGADAANARLLEEGAVVADTDNLGAGAPALIVIATYNAGSIRLKPAASSGYSTLPAEKWESAYLVSWLIDARPTARSPFVLTHEAQSGRLAAKLDISGGDSTRIVEVLCQVGSGTKVLISDEDVHTDDPACEVRRHDSK